ncbi:helix-turn-helix domain-containing protein [Kribbella ginsengisoli]|uniref:Site-specific integrase n=1 Tax=Kribbella ginsengisoli TaxID=363865 RepID=A0ABP6Z7E0_9ACTN
MGRKPLPMGSWGKIRTYEAAWNEKGKATSHRSVASYRDFDGRVRQVEAYGRTKTQAEADLQEKLKNRRKASQGTELTAMDRFSVAAEIWFSKLEEKVRDGKRSPGTVDTYRRQLDNHVLPAIGEVRLGELRTPLLDKVVGAIKKDVGPATAKTCRSVVSGTLGLAARYGAIDTNPIRDVDTIESESKRKARALTDEERDAWFEQLRADPSAVAADLPDLTTFMLATGVRIGEALGVHGEQINLAASEVEITHQIIRIKGQGLVRIKTKSRAGERVLKVPAWGMAMLRTRLMNGGRLDEPVFADSRGSYRDPANTRRDLREARSPIGGETRQELGRLLRKARRAAGLSQTDTAARLGWAQSRVSLIETARVRLELVDAAALLDLYRVSGTERAELLEVAGQAAEGSQADALAWITSHSFRKTTATILDDAGQSARQIADQLGHARPSLTQDVYMARRAKNPAAAAALEAALNRSSEVADRLGHTEPTGTTGTHG